MRQAEVAGLRVRLLGGEDGQGGGDGPLVVLLHGYGAPGDDLVPLARELTLPQSVRFAFPEGMLPINFGDSFYHRAEPRAWWPIDLLALQTAGATGRSGLLPSEYPDGLSTAREAIIRLLDALECDLSVSSAAVVLGGFSQGAILACDVALHDARPFCGIVMLSGSLIGEAVWQPRFAAREGTRTFQSHGIEDPILPFDLGRELHRRLAAAKWQAEFVEFRGGHGIAHEAFAGLRTFLLRVLQCRS